MTELVAINLSNLHFFHIFYHKLKMVQNDALSEDSVAAHYSTLTVLYSAGRVLIFSDLIDEKKSESFSPSSR